jgi:hypothetical protein
VYFRVKRTGSYAYLQIVESFREQGQVRQRVLSTVGRLDTLQLERLRSRVEQVYESNSRGAEV